MLSHRSRRAAAIVRVATVFSALEFAGGTAGASSAPPWAFNGAYIGYLVAHSNYPNSTFTEDMALTAGHAFALQWNISKVDASSGTYFETCSANGDRFNDCGGSTNVSFAAPYGSFFVGGAFLEQFNSGQVPSFFSNQGPAYCSQGGCRTVDGNWTVHTNQVVTVPLGTFDTDVLSGCNAGGCYNTWYDMNSGLTVKQFNTAGNFGSDGQPVYHFTNMVLFELSSSNIPISHASSTTSSAPSVGGGIPEFPLVPLGLVAVTLLVLVSYLVVRVRTRPASLLGYAIRIAQRSCCDRRTPILDLSA